MRRILLCGPAVIFLGTALAFVIMAQADVPPPGKQPEGSEVTSAQSIPESERQRKCPTPVTPESLENGETYFSTQCTMCHGERGDGRGDLVGRLGLKMPDFTDPTVQARRTDGELFYVLSRGRGGMQGEEKRLSEKVRWDLVHYVRTLTPTDKR